MPKSLEECLSIAKSMDQLDRETAHRMLSEGKTEDEVMDHLAKSLAKEEKTLTREVTSAGATVSFEVAPNPANAADISVENFESKLLESKDDSEYNDNKQRAAALIKREVRLAELGRYEDTDGKENGRLVRPPIKDGRITLVHYSTSKDLRSIDPEYYGTNHKGAEFKRYYDANWVDKSFYGIGIGEPGGYRRKSMVGTTPYSVEVNAALMYDMAADPDGLRNNLEGNNQNEKINLYEKRIKEAGYVGYWVPHPSLGMVAGVFDKVKIGQTLSQSTGDPVIYHQSGPERNSLGLYSRVEKSVLTFKLPAWKKPDGTAKGRDIWAKINSEKLPSDELETLGLEEFLTADPQAKFTRDQVAAYVRANGVKMEEVNSGYDPNSDVKSLEWEDITKDNEDEILDLFPGEKATLQLSAGFDYDIYILGSDDTGYMVLRDSWRPDDGGIVSDVYIASVSEAQVVAQGYAEDEELVDTTGGARWEEYTMEGDHTNYREKRIILPDLPGDFYNTAHFPERNIVAFLRVDDRTLSTGIPDRVVKAEPFEVEVTLREQAPGMVHKYVIDINNKYTGDTVYTFAPDLSKYDHDPSKALEAARKIIAEAPKDAKVAGGYVSAGDGTLVGKDKVIKRSTANTYFIDETQSDIHSEGRKRGYRLSGAEIDEVYKKAKALIDESKTHPVGSPERKRLEMESLTISNRASINDNLVPNAPFKGDAWLSLALKRAVVDAVDNGYEAIAWPNSVVMANRWSDSYDYKPQYDKKMPSMIRKITGTEAKQMDVDGGEYDASSVAVPDHFIFEEDGSGGWYIRNIVHSYIGGPESPRTFESKSDAENYVKEILVGLPEGYWIIPITDQLRAKVRGEGMPLFQTERGNITLTDDQRIINLGKASDLSTFLHESGHLFLEMEKFYAKKYGLSDNQKAILKWLGVDSFDDITVEDHERWAETFEVYLREGKAPSLDLRRAFAAFARWLKVIYRTLRDDRLTRADLSPEISGIFDRLLATQDAIDEAAANPEYDQMFRSQEQAGMTDAEWAKYQKRAARVKETTERTLDEKALAQYMKMQTRAWNDEKEPLIEQETDRLRKEPVYAIMSDLRAFKGDDGLDVAEGRMDTEMLKALFPDGKIPGRFIGNHVKSGEGVDPALYAEAYGYPSANAMVEDIMSKPTLKEAADQAAQDIMVEKYGDIINDGTLLQEAKEALINEDHAKLLLSEISTKRPGINRRYLKAEAERTIGLMTYKQIKPEKYYRAMIRAAKDSMTMEDPTEAKIRELSNHYLYKVALDVKEQMETHRRYVKATKNREYDTRKVAGEYIKQIRMLSEMYEMKDPQAQQATLSAILDFYSAQLNELGGDLTDLSLLDPNLIRAIEWREAHGTSLVGFELVQFDDMPAEDLRGVVEMLKHLRYVGGQIAEMNGDEAMKVRLQFAQWIKDKGGKDHKIQRGRNRRQNVAKEWNHLINTMPSLANMVRKLDGDADGGMAFELIYKLISNAEDTKLGMNHKFYSEFEDLMGDMSSVGLSHRDAKTYTLENGTTEEFSSEEAFMMALYWGTESSRDAIMQGWGMTENDVTRILSRLTPRQLKLANAVWAMNESQWPDLKAASEAMIGVAPPKLEARPFTVNGVEMTGGHMQLFYDSNRVELANEQESARRTSAIMPGKAGSLNARKGSGGKHVLLDVSNITRSVDDKIHYIAYAKAGRTLRQILNHDEITAAIERKHGPGFYKAFIESIEGITGGRVAQETHRSGAKISRYMRQNATLKHLGYSLRNTIQQVSAIPIAMKEVGPVKWAQAAMQTYGFKREMVQFINSKSQFMNNRSQVVNRDSREFMKKMIATSKADARWQAFKSHAFILQTTVDMWVSYPTWLASYQNAMEKHGDDARARIEADTSVAQSVGSGSDMHLGRIMQSNQNEWVKTITVFGSWFNAYYQRLYKSSKGGEDFMNMEFAVDALILPIIVSTITQALILDTPDPDETWYQYLAKNTFGFLLGTIPVLNQITTFMSGFTPSAPISALPETLIKAPKELYAYSQGNQTGLKTVADVGSLVTSLVPAPSSGQVWRMLDYVDSYMRGEEDGFNPYQMFAEGRDKDK